jgi:hypothetical protein
MKNIHVLPTDKPSRLYLHSNNELQLRTNIIRTSEDYLGINQHIYITSDEEIKDVRPHKGKWQLEKEQILNKFPNYLTDLSECKLVILTTDPQLIADGVQAIDNGFLEWFVKNPSCEWVCTIKNVHNYEEYRSYFDYKIIIPQEEPKMIECYFIPTNNTSSATICGNCGKEKFLHTIGSGIKTSKQQPLEEAAERLYPENWESIMDGQHDSNSYERNAFIKGAKWQQERMYSEEDLKEAYSMGISDMSIRAFNERFKKK